MSHKITGIQNLKNWVMTSVRFAVKAIWMNLQKKPNNIPNNHLHILCTHLCFICIDGDVMKRRDIFTTRVFCGKAAFSILAKPK